MFENLMKTMRKKFEWHDISILKICVLVFGLWLAKVFPAVLGLNTWVYFIAWLGLMIYLLVRLN